MSVPFQLTKSSIFDNRRTPISKDSEFSAALLISSPLGPSLRSESRERCTRFLVNKDMNSTSQMVTKIKTQEDSEKGNSDAKDPFTNHQFAFKLVKKNFTKKRASCIRTNGVRGLHTLENVALARKLRAAIEEQQDSKYQLNLTQKENEPSFLQSVDRSRPATKHQLRIQTPEFRINFEDKCSKTATNIMKNSTTESFYSIKEGKLVERESTILSLQRPLGSPQVTTEKRLNAAQTKMSKLVLRISSATSTKAIQSADTLKSINSEILRLKSFGKNNDTSTHIKRAMTPSVGVRSRLILKSRPDTSLDTFSSNRLESVNKAKQLGRSSKDSMSCGRETTDHTPNVTKTEHISSRVFVNDGIDKKTCVSSSIQELPSLNTSIVLKNDGKAKTENNLKSKRTTRDTSRQFEVLTESVHLKNDRSSTEGLVKSQVIEEKQEVERENREEEENDAKERDLRERLLGASLSEREDCNAGYKIPIQQKSILRVSSAKQDNFRSKISEEYQQAKTEINQLAMKVNNILEAKGVTRNQSKKEMEFVPGSSGTLNEMEVEFIKGEYAKKAEGDELINYDQIDNLVSRLKYFSRLPKDVRMGLLRNGSYAYYFSGNTVFKQGDYGDLMYVILRGSVNVRVNKKTSFGVLENSIVATLYDGVHFGEYTITTALEQPDNRKDQPKEVDKKPLHRLKTFGFGEQNVNLEEISEEEQEYNQQDALNELKTPEALTFSQKNSEDRPRRMATVEAAESCDILCIPRDKFQEVFLNLVQKELDDKVKALSEIPFLSKLDPLELMPLANNLTTKVYKMDEIIQAAGEPVEKFRLISKGRCQVVLGVTKKCDAPPKTMSNRVTSARRFNTGLAEFTAKETSARPETSNSITGKRDENSTNKKVSDHRAFNYERVGEEGGRIVYKEHVSFATLSRGQFIGGRALLTEQDWKGEYDYFQVQLRLNRLAKVSLVADTPTVEVLEITRDRLKYIPESLLKTLKQGLINAKEFDDYDIENELELNRKWSEFKASQIAEVMKSKTPTFRSTFKIY